MKLNFYILALASLFLTLSCASTPIDRGTINPENISEDDLVKIIINKDISVLKINENDVEFLNIEKSIMYGESRREQIIKIPPGFYIFHVKHSDGVSFPDRPIPVIAQLVKSNTYLLGWEKQILSKRTPTSPERALLSIHIYLYNKKIKGEDVTIKLNK
ncbi:MAG: hypothetical protein FWB86_11485 [Treponema sp.]|nr:hypothetical protein [Treponema sp.]MCL2252534.1 hypothetical protein [Treponema sp.]